MKNHNQAREDAQIIQARIEGTQFGESLDWEKLRIVEEFRADRSYILMVKGDGDLAASVIADMKGEVHESAVEGDFWLIEIPVE